MGTVGHSLVERTTGEGRSEEGDGDTRRPGTIGPERELCISGRGALWSCWQEPQGGRLPWLVASLEEVFLFFQL